MVTRTDYDELQVGAAHSIVIELIYYCLKNYPGGLDQLIELFKPHMENGLVIEGLQKLEKNFKSVEHTGPKFVADFEEIEDGEKRNMFERDAFERVQHLLKGLEMI
jgi:hypothetical protein